jgi:hypothetical protein
MNSTRRMILMIAVFLMFIPVLSLADNEVDLPATGQATCYDESGNVMSCSVTDSKGQDAEVMAGFDWSGWDTYNNRFTNNLDGTVTDRLTGLMWLQNGNCISSTSFDTDNTAGDGKVTRLHGLDFINGINDETYSNCGAGYTDWRLPNVNELESLVHAEKADTSAWLNSQPFMNVQPEFYWSSTWRSGGDDVLIVSMGAGGIIPASHVTDQLVLPVRAGQFGSPDPAYPANIWKTGQNTCFDDSDQTPLEFCAGTGQDGEIQAGVDWPSTRFTDNLDGTMNDNLPELMWLKDANCISTQYPSFDSDAMAGDGMVKWQHALDFVKGINDGTYSNCGGGYTDWRLPNRKELRSLYNYDEPITVNDIPNSAWLENEGFSNVLPDNYWTSTTIAAYTDMAWRITLSDKEVADSLKETSYHYAWPVRDGILNADITVTDATPPVDDHFVHLGDVSPGNFSDQKVTITNDGNANLNIGGIGNNDPLAEPFSIVYDNCRGQSLLPSESCDVTIRFAPHSGSHFTDSFDIVHYDTNESPVIVSVRGNNIYGGIIELPRTGRVWSYYPFDDGYFMAGTAWPSPRFVDEGGGTMTDKLTGLMWTKNADLLPGAKTWQEALNFAAGLDIGCCDDWRLPNVVELESLVHAGVADTAAWLNNQGFQNVQAGDYWSSTTDMFFTDEARSVNMSTGSVSRGSKGSNFYVWAVRAGQKTGSPNPAYPANMWKTGQTDCYDQTGNAISCTGTGQDGDIQAGVAWPSPRFGDRGETQSDKLTGLIWATDADLPGAGMGFWDALAYIQGMNAGTYDNFGYVTWRLPNRKELLSLADFSQDSPVLPAGHEFTNVQSDFYWSSTVSSSTPDAAWTIFMDEGFMLNNYFSGVYRIWPVLGGSFACVISAAPDAMVESNQPYADLGVSVSGAGDVNGDGFDDVIAGAPFYGNVEVYEGAAFVYHGSASGISTTPAVILESNKHVAYMGVSVSGAGNVNGDEYDDVIAGAHLYDNGEMDEGAAYMYHGSASGISTTPAVILESNQVDGFMGNSVSGAGNVNGDAWDDVIVGAFGEGAAYVYHGSASGISTTPAIRLESNQPNAYLGFSVSGAGDVNADGYDDVIVGAPRYNNNEVNEGGVFVYYGSASGISASPDVILESNQAEAKMGSSLSGAGDVNNDGWDDIIVGVYNESDTSGGKAYVYHGSASGISTTPAVILVSKISYRRIANSVSGAGDVNADGFDDIIIGAKDYLDGFSRGAAFVYLGGASGISEYPGAKVHKEQSDQKAEMGYSVSGTGDVNGDGFADVIVGARHFDNGEEDEGAAFIYHGKGCRTSELCMPPFHDSDWDRICDDGDLSGTAGDNPCTGGNTFFCDDNCPDDVNTGQADVDGDGIGDACEGGGTDSDGDGIPDDQDNCPDIPNGPEGGTCSAGTIGDPCTSNGNCGCLGECSNDQEDVDEDGVGDVCDNCPEFPNANQNNADGDDLGDTCDNCRGASNPDQLDSNTNCPDPPYTSDPLCGDVCETSNPDADDDGVPDDADNCLSIPNGPAKGSCFNYFTHEVWGECLVDGSCQDSSGQWYKWCDILQGDQDSDGIGDVCDNCPATPNGPAKGSCFNYFTHAVWGECLDDGSCQDGSGQWHKWCDAFQGDGDSDGTGDVCDSTPLP